MIFRVWLHNLDITGAVTDFTFWHERFPPYESDGYAYVNEEDGFVYRHWAGLIFEEDGQNIYQSKPGDLRIPELVGPVVRGELTVEDWNMRQEEPSP